MQVPGDSGENLAVVIHAFNHVLSRGKASAEPILGKVKQARGQLKLMMRLWLVSDHKCLLANARTLDKRKDGQNSSTDLGALGMVAKNVFHNSTEAAGTSSDPLRAGFDDDRRIDCWCQGCGGSFECCGISVCSCC